VVEEACPSFEVVSPPLVVGDLPLVVVGQTSYVLVMVEVGDLGAIGWWCWTTFC